jgi:hypothetical protein
VFPNDGLLLLLLLSSSSFSSSLSLSFMILIFPALGRSYLDAKITDDD